MIVINADTGLELNEVTEMDINDTLNLQVVITPSNAYYTDIHFRFSEQSGVKYWEHIEVTQDGKLTFSYKLPVSPETYLTVLSGAVISKEYKIVMKHIPVEKVEPYTTSYIKQKTRLIKPCLLYTG